MKKTALLAGCAALLLATACNKKNMDNPFLQEGGWNTPYGIPDFAKIKPEHYLPAFEEGMRQQKKEVEDIVNSKDEPTFQNTIEALENSGMLLGEVSAVFFNLSSCENSPEMDDIAEKITPKLSAHSDDINLNAKLFARIKAVYDKRGSLGLAPEQERLLEETYKNFVRGGANVPAEKQPRFREVNAQIADLERRFGKNVLDATNDYTLVLDKEEQLAGLPAGQVAAAKELANEKPETKGKYAFNLTTSSWEPFLMYAQNRDLRQQIWQAYTSRCLDGKFSNRQVIDSLVNLRMERAQILGFESHAAFVLDDCLAKTPKAVYDCLMQIWKPALAKAKQERDEYQKMIEKDLGKDAKLQPWDWRYYSEKMRMERYDLSDDSIRPYFPLDSVLQGAFRVATRLYGLQFVETDTLPTYDKEARSFLVMDSGRVSAILYMDFFPRASKRSGAWMTGFREQYVDRNGNNVIPIISIV
ncbi:MAG: M3 family metallopeptidase, partial [Bacteroidales bacterium]|nr:M3 family metallopeptidase [Bacteroidales bacterium]